MAKPGKPHICNVEANKFVTHMFETTIMFLGDPSDDIPTKENPGVPYIIVCKCFDGTTTPSHYHPDYSYLTFPTGGYHLGDTFYPAGTVMLTEPGGLTGECGPGPGGCTERALYVSGWASTPFFVDPTEPRAKAMLSEMGPLGESIAKVERPAPNPNAGFQLLDREKHKIVGDGYVAYSCQVGPDGFGKIADSSDSCPYAVLMEMQQGASVAEHSHDGWAAISIHAGAIEVDSVLYDEASMIGYAPGVPMAFKAGPAGAEILVNFASGKTSIPIFADPAAAGASAVRALFGAA